MRLVRIERLKPHYRSRSCHCLSRLRKRRLRLGRQDRREHQRRQRRCVLRAGHPVRLRLPTPPRRHETPAAYCAGARYLICTSLRERHARHHRLGVVSISALVISSSFATTEVRRGRGMARLRCHVGCPTT